MSVELQKKVAPPLNEICDLGSCPAPALVAAEWTSGRLVFCGHHFDALHPVEKARCKSIYDTRV